MMQLTFPDFEKLQNIYFDLINEEVENIENNSKIKTLKKI